MTLSWKKLRRFYIISLPQTISPCMQTEKCAYAFVYRRQKRNYVTLCIKWPATYFWFSPNVCSFTFKSYIWVLFFLICIFIDDFKCIRSTPRTNLCKFRIRIHILQFMDYIFSKILPFLMVLTQRSLNDIKPQHLNRVRVYIRVNEIRLVCFIVSPSVSFVDVFFLYYFTKIK